MCGVAGYIGNFSPTLISDMVDAIKHRGPDGNGTYLDDVAKVALGHTRLSIIDLSEGGNQPMVAPGRAVITYNGEIYNFREIRKELELKGYVFNSSSDTEVLLKAYLEYGKKSFAKLNGIFAVAIWDMERKKLILARDGMGVKPLYIAKNRNGVLFASELKALITEKSLTKEIDPVAAAQYLTFLWTPGERTMLKSVRKVEPGTILEIDLNINIKAVKFHDQASGIPDNSLREREAIELVRETVKQAVERQMVADVEVGSFLSGGLDSSSIAAFANQMTDKKLQCFTMDYRQDVGSSGEMENDLPYARRVAKSLGVELHEVQVDHSMVTRLPEMIYQLDEPQADPAILNSLFICELANRHGIKVLMSGAGGDDIFTGYRRHYALNMEKYWSWLPQSMRNGLKCFSSHLPVNNTSFRKFRKVFDHAHLSADRRMVSYYYWLDPDSSRSLLSSDLRFDVDTMDVIGPLINTLGDLSNDIPPINRMLTLDSKYFLTDHNLNYTDKIGMACGVEVRVPLLDKELVDLSNTIPVSMKQKGNVGKWIFKKAMEGVLPNDVIYRPKTGFGVPLRQWLKGDFGTYVRDALSSDKFRSRGLFDSDQVDSLMKDTRSGKIDGTYALLGLLCQEIWCQNFLDQ